MKRAAALVAAVLMVVGALAYRSARGDGGDASHEDADELGVVCAEELADVCRAAGIEVAATPTAGETADQLIASQPLPGSAWVTTSAWADLVQAERDRLGEEQLAGVAGEPLASSPVVLAIWEDRAAELAERCGLPAGQLPGWRCLAEQTGSTLSAGDRVRVASPRAEGAVGLVVAASQAAGIVGRADFATNDPDAQDLVAIAPAIAGGPAGDLDRMRSRGPGEITAAGTVRADAENRRSNLGTIAAGTPRPEVRADVVLVVPAGGSVPDDVRRRLADALIAAGWGAPDSSPSGLPSGGVLAAIRTLWAQSR